MEKIMKQKKIWIAAGAALFLVLAAVIAVFAGRKEPAYRSIRIVELSGSVSIERSGMGTLTASENMNLVSGDRVATDKEAYVVLCLDTDKYVMLGEAGAMTVVAEGDGKSGKTSINLEGGSVLNEIRNPLSEGSSYEIATPNATMSVRGTVFEVRKEDKGDGQVTVLVYDGSVAVALNQKDAVLYGAGEYTVFTDEEVPTVIVERGTVSGEVLDDQVRQRLQEIQSEGRPLNVGNADLSDEELTASVPTASPEGEKKENNVTATPAPTATPDATATPAPTATPDATATPAPTATPDATATPAPTATPVVTATPAPTATPVVTVTPVPVTIVTVTPAPAEAPIRTEAPASEPEEDDEEPDEDDYEEPAPTAAPTREPAPTAAPTREPAPTAAPTREPAPTTAPTREPAPTADPVQPTEPPKKGHCRVSYVIPYILIDRKEPENAAEAAGIKPAHSYGVGEAKKGYPIWPQKDAEVTSIPNHMETRGLELTFVGWYQENGDVWKFNEYVIMEDTVLYPVWKDKDGNLYKVKVLKELGVCYSVNVGPESSPSPEPSGSPSPEPSGSPSPEPSGSPSPEPSGSPSPEPSGSPSPEPSGEPAGAL